MSLIHSANELNRLINKSNDVINNTKLKLEREECQERLVMDIMLLTVEKVIIWRVVWWK